MIRLSRCELPVVGPAFFAASERGLALLSLADEGSARRRLDRLFPGVPVEPDATAGFDCEARVAEYLRGERRRLDLPLDLRGTEFQRRVWEAIAAIPYGETRTYSEIAAAAGRPGAARAAGAATGANPVCLVIPCHRVLGCGGRLTGYAYGLPCKERLLRLESGCTL